MFRPPRQFKLVVLAILFALSTAQCSPAKPSPTEMQATDVPPTPASIEATAERIQLNYISFFQGYTVGLNQAERELIERFEAAHPDIQVNRKDYSTRYEELISAATPPDVIAVFMNADPFLEAEVAQDHLLDLSQLWAEHHWLETYPPYLESLSTVQGKQYYLPILSYWEAIYYNRSVFEAYTLTPPKTWDEFLEVCETLKHNGVAPLSGGAKYSTSAILWFTYLDLRFNGTEFHTALMNGQVLFNDPRLRPVFEAWKVLLDSEYFISNADRIDDQEAATMVVEGKAAMMLAPPYLWEAYGEADRAKLDLFDFPTTTPDVPVGEHIGTLGYLIPAQASHPAEAQTWAAYVGSAEAQTILAQGIGLAPSNAEVDSALLSPSVRKGIALMQAVDQAAPWFSLDPYYLNQFLTGREDIDSVLAGLEKDRLKKFGQPDSP
jgi:ABC-type glycerol-3-phosphate transport system substrate-binding protein